MSTTTDNSQAVIRIKGLKKHFGDLQVLNDISIDLQPGENLVVLGKSGSGKSVLIKCIIGLLFPDAGTIQVFEEEITQLSGDDLDKMRLKIGFLFQSNALYDSMTIRQNLEFPLRRHWVTKTTTKEEINALVTEALDSVGLPDTIDKMPEELSGGMQKRIALARTLIMKPKIILYDEPTTGLDPITGREICNLILDIQKKYNTSSIIISHDMNCVKITANRIVILIDGLCYAMGTYEEFKNSSDEKIQQFFK
jgi:phospholipid/cholesterol/gamma-HCH transport system ATP-binding protein